MDLQENITDQTSLLPAHIAEAAISPDHGHSSDSPKSEPLLSDEQQSDLYSGGPLIRHHDASESPQIVYREVILVTIAVFMGYASLVVVQKKLYDQFEKNNGGNLSNVEEQYFEHGTSLVYFGNLCFRLLHNIVFSKLTPRHRVVLSLVLVAVSMSTLVAFYFVFLSQWVGWVYLAYLCGGVAIGSFESNLLSTITPLGSDTKVWYVDGTLYSQMQITPF